MRNFEMDDWYKERAALAVERAFALMAADLREAADVELVHAVHEGVRASDLVDAVVEQSGGTAPVQES